MTPTTYSPIATRFAWKEYRTLRGFWLAALVIAALLQVVAVTFAPRGSDPSSTVFGIALAAAALYAVGVAATTFSMEHEEDTYSYLTGLPTRWLPLVAGKLSFAFTSSLALALALVLCGWILSGWNLPSRGVALDTLGLFGFAIVEMIAWGTLFSLLLRQPLLAALLAIGTESLVLTIAVNTYAERTLPDFLFSSYVQVLPTRLAIAACVFAIDVFLARRWLVLDKPRSVAKLPITIPSPSAAAQLPTTSRDVSPIAGSRLDTKSRVLSRLLWQTWRGSGRLVLIAIAVAALLCCVPYLALSDVLRFPFQDQFLTFAPFAVGLVAAALYASLLFSADQRGRSYRFLAEHAAWPRFVWFARLAVWFVPALIILGVAATMWEQMARGLAAALLGIDSDSAYWRGHSHEIDFFAGALSFAAWGILLGFAVGQACSLFFRRAIVAGFAAAVISIPLLIWGFAIWSWELPRALFLLPLVIGLFAATWLRMPDWLIDRHSPRAWLKVAAAVAIPILFVAWRLPAARKLPPKNDHVALAQIASAMGTTTSFNGGTRPFELSAVIEKWITQLESAATDAERATGDRLIRLSELIEKPPLPTRTAAKPDPTQTDWYFYQDRLVELNRAITDEAAALSAKNFVFPSMFVLDLPPKHNLEPRSDPNFDRLTSLVELLSHTGVAATQEGQLDDALRLHLAALRLWDHLDDATSAGVTPSKWVRLRLQSNLVDWADAKGQTSDRIRAAIAALDAIYPPLTSFPASDQFEFNAASLTGSTPPARLMIEYLSLRDILLGKHPSTLLTPNAGYVNYFPVLVNELHFERARALKLLEYLLVVRAAQWYDVVSNINQDYLQHLARDNDADGNAANTVSIASKIRGQIQLAYESSFDQYPQFVPHRDYPPYSWLRTTVLLRNELDRHGPYGRWLTSVVDRQVAAWGLRQQLALVAYRLDHGNYPDSLDRLVPDYLPFLPIDAYSGLPFEYRPQGLPLELRGDYGADSNLAAGTPLLWSVGPGDSRLQVVTVVDAVDPDADAGNSQEADGAVRSTYDFIRRDYQQYWYSERPLVFPLPKLPSKSPNLPPP